ncbi:Membrane protein involved in colicin uptake [Aminobacter sp. J15]|nr:Membrane protein involved in colicin uptake [Aminobacter sp. J15]
MFPGLTGAQTDFTFPFQYLAKEHVKATVDGASVPFTWISTFTIKIEPAPVGELRIYRDTPRDSLINVYSDGSILIDDDLNASFWQSLMVADEVADAALTKGEDGHWDAVGLRVTNLGTPVNPTDAVSRQWAETSMTSTLAQAISAKNSAEAARDAAIAARDTAISAAGTSTAKAGEAAASAAAAAADKATVANDKAIVAADKATVAADKATVASDKATVAADKATVLGYKNDVAADKATVASDKNTAINARDAAVAAKDAAEAARDIALAAAGSLTFARINANGEMEFVLNDVVVAKLTPSGTFLTKGDIGINQTI